MPIIFAFTVFVWVLFKRKSIFHKTKNYSNKPFVLIHLGIFILQLLFAFYSVGNAEFMVMLPFPLLIVLIYYTEIKAIALWLFVAVLLTWNLMLGILPNYMYNYCGTEYIVSKIIHNNPAFYIVNDKPLIENILYYKYGNDITRNITSEPDEYAINRPLAKLSDTINYLLNRGEKIYTNSIDKPKIMNRAALVLSANDDEFFKNYKTVKTDSFDTFYGRYYFFNVLRKDSLK